MTTISKNSLYASIGTASTYKRTIVVSGENQAKVMLKQVQLTPEQKADLAQRKAVAAKIEAASEKQRLEVEKSKHVENHDMILANISDLSPQNAKKALGVVQVMIENREDAGLNVYGRYGNRTTSDLNTYMSWLKESIAKYNAMAAAGEPTTVKPSSEK